MKQEQIWGSVEEWGIEQPGRRMWGRYLRRGIGVLCLFLLLGGLYSTAEFPLVISQSFATAEDACTNVKPDIEQPSCSESLWDVCGVLWQFDAYEGTEDIYPYPDFYCRAAKVIEAWELSKRSQFENKNPFIPPTVFFECFALRDCTVVLYTQYRHSKAKLKYFHDSEIDMYDMISEILLNYAPFLSSIKIRGPY